MKKTLTTIVLAFILAFSGVLLTACAGGGEHQHSFKLHEAVAATCTENGYEEYWECSDCGKKFSDKDGKNEINKPIEIPAKGHTLTKHETVDSNCTDVGVEEYWECSVCDKLFSDKDGKNEIDKPIVIPAKGHKYPDTYESDETHHWRVCSVCNTPSEREAHSFDMDDVCKVCEYDNGKYKNFTFEIGSDGNYKIVSYSDKTAEEVVIPESFKGIPVTEIGTKAFRESALVRIVIPDSIRVIGAQAFYKSVNLKEVSMGSNVESIGDHAFRECTALEKINICDKTETIGQYAFGYCSALSSVSIGSGIKSIANYAFVSNTGLKSFDIRDLGAWCMADRGNENSNPMWWSKGFTVNGQAVSEIVLPKNVSAVMPFAFVRAANLKKAVLCPDNLTKIGESAFEECKNLETVEIGNGGTVIGEQAFWRCSGLTSLKVGSGIKDFGYMAFSGCSGLKSVDITNIADWAQSTFFKYNEEYPSMTPGGYAANPLLFAKTLKVDGEEISELRIPDGVTEISAAAFAGAQNVTDVYLPSSIVSIGSNAFSACKKIQTFFLPLSVKSIGTDVFQGIGNKIKIFYEGTKEQWDSAGVVVGDTVYIPQRLLYFSKDRPANFVSDRYWHYVNGKITIWE